MEVSRSDGMPQACRTKGPASLITCACLWCGAGHKEQVQKLQGLLDARLDDVRSLERQAGSARERIETLTCDLQRKEMALATQTSECWRPRRGE